MSVSKHPIEWANEMDRMMRDGGLNAENYLTDCAHAVVYVRESAETIKKQNDILSDILKLLEEQKIVLNAAYCILAEHKELDRWEKDVLAGGVKGSWGWRIAEMVRRIKHEQSVVN